MLRVGLTGGIGAGKSEVSRRLAGKGAVLIDADAIAREVVEPGTPGLAAVTEAFGTEVLLPSGQLDRPRLGEIVFGDPAKLELLNGILHPLIGARMADLERSAGAESVVVHDVPLLAENNLGFGYDVVVVVDAPQELQLRRLTQERKMSREAALARVAAQATREQRLAVADLVIDNSRSLDELDKQVENVWAELQRRAHAGSP